MAALPLGRLPGDIYVRRGNFSFYVPLATSVVVSIILTLIFAFFRRSRARPAVGRAGSTRRAGLPRGAPARGGPCGGGPPRRRPVLDMPSATARRHLRVG